MQAAIEKALKQQRNNFQFTQMEMSVLVSSLALQLSHINSKARKTEKKGYLLEKKAIVDSLLYRLSVNLK